MDIPVKNPNEEFKTIHEPIKEEPWEPFFDCISFATPECEGDCEYCEAPKDVIEQLCTYKW